MSCAEAIERNGQHVAAEPMPLRLNLGSGPLQLDGYENLDRKTGQEIYPLDYADGSVEEVRASHCLEHFPHGQVVDVVREWVRVLKPGGVLRVAVPDLEWIAKQYIDGANINVQGYLMGGQTDADDFHRCAFDEELLRDAFRAAGLVDIRRWQSEIRDCASLPVSLNLQGTKPGPVPKLKVSCCMSVPRLGFQDNFFSVVRGLLPLGIMPTKIEGAFWGQCLERVMSECLDFDWILTTDYDSVFTRASAAQLLRLADSGGFDAIAPVQARRNGGPPLLTLPDEQGGMAKYLSRDDFQHDLVPAHSAHFGLTMIRVEALKRMPHPWFLGVPNDQGEWGDGRTDDDVYFWRKWLGVGNTLAIAPHVVIGHAELLITWPDQNFEPIHQPPVKFWADGAPANVWR